MIRSFRCKDTQALFEGGDPRRFRAIKDAAIRKLSQLDAAHTLEFLRSPPGNQLEALKHDRIGQHSIRINRQWRVCFVWTLAGPENVEIVDYH
ncbi:type II toxin-antitoxin system RelE/ParE family toxin [Dyella subtropica]|uniref:type II toxin-antitoxin system RelE/ParE family toxin n=1 Tax=Dyella subtropica TaxID=2992127 RepID=UPI00224F5146|nr:type II toxin-antitoxin system RelE/ParE family toxin [Dyella subtropica]